MTSKVNFSVYFICGDDCLNALVSDRDHRADLVSDLDRRDDEEAAHDDDGATEEAAHDDDGATEEAAHDDGAAEEAAVHGDDGEAAEVAAVHDDSRHRK